MELYLLAYIGISCLLVLLIALKFKKKIPHKENPYERVDRLFSPNERSFYAVLCQACDKKAVVFGKTNLKGILNAQLRLQEQQNKLPKKAAPQGQQLIDTPQKHLKKLSNTCFDYIVCDRSNMQVIAVIELEVEPKDSNIQVKRSRKLAAACKSAKLPLLQFKAANKYVVTDLEKALFDECADRSHLLQFDE